MDRRLFLKRAASLIAAPAIVQVAALMPIRGASLLWGDIQQIAGGHIFAGDVVIYDRNLGVWHRADITTLPAWDAIGIALAGVNRGNAVNVLTHGKI